MRDEVRYDKAADRSVSASERQYRCKTLIVGEGLADAALGFLLRKAGDDVLLLELLDAKEKDKLIATLTSEMKDAASRLDFETAAYLRDKIRALRETK